MRSVHNKSGSACGSDQPWQGRALDSRVLGDTCAIHLEEALYSRDKSIAACRICQAPPNRAIQDLQYCHLPSMSLHEVWEAAAGNPFQPSVSKDYQFTLGFSLLLAGVVLTILFGLNRSIVSLPLYGIPASLAFGFGAVYTICAVGVYV